MKSESLPFYIIANPNQENFFKILLKYMIRHFSKIILFHFFLIQYRLYADANI